jgi:hypothetical protein
MVSWHSMGKATALGAFHGLMAITMMDVGVVPT